MPTNKQYVEVFNDGQNDLYIRDAEAISKTVSILYADLVTLRDNSALIPGQWYRITDYVTTTAAADTQSAGHQFDVIVRADDVDTLNEKAFAAKHSGDTYFSTAGSNLEAWELKYCLDNDTDRFEWADATNGKGVIYYMKDDHGNELPYDFKNIQFKRPLLAGRAGLVMKAEYIADSTYNLMAVKAMSVIATCFGSSRVSSNAGYYHSLGTAAMVSGSTLTDSYVDYQGNAATIDSSATYVRFLPVNGPSVYCKVVEFNFHYTFDYNYGAEDMSLKITEYGNTMMIYGGAKQKLNNNVFIHYNNTQYPVYGNHFGSDCCNNTFSNQTYNNMFGNSIHNNTLGDSCYDNQIGNSFSENIIGSRFYRNTVGNFFNANTLGSSCYDNQIGNGCFNNVIGRSSQCNCMGNYCYRNVLGEFCRYNIFANSFTCNSFGNQVGENVFGTVSYIVGGADEKSLFDYFYNSIIETGNCRIYINCTETTSISSICRNIKISSGVNMANTYKTLDIDVVNNIYQIEFYAAASEKRGI